MDQWLFTLLSFLYVVSLALVDGLFNRLVFREKGKEPYSSPYKQEIYKRWEWWAIGVTLLILLPVVLPSVAAYFIGGLSFLLIYLIVLLIIPWDVIFGLLVFGDPLGDTPSIALPLYGWVHLPLWFVTVARLFIASFLFLLLTKL